MARMLEVMSILMCMSLQFMLPGKEGPAYLSFVNCVAMAEEVLEPGAALSSFETLDHPVFVSLASGSLALLESRTDKSSVCALAPS